MEQRKESSNSIKELFVLLGMLFLMGLALFVAFKCFHFLMETGKEQATEQIAQRKSTALKEFVFEENKTFVITGKRTASKIISATTIQNIGILTIMSGKDFYQLQVPLKTYAASYPGLEINIQTGEDESYALSENGEEVYYLDEIEFED